MALAAAGVFAAISSQLAAQVPRATAVGFTAAQAERGQAGYAEHCASCHGANLDDGAFAPPLSGMDFRQKWGDQSPEALFTKTSTSMPPARPGSLSDETYSELLAYILRENGVRAGERPFPASPSALKALALPSWPRGGGGGLAPGAAVPPAPTRANPLQKITPVTDAMLDARPATASG